MVNKSKIYIKSIVTCTNCNHSFVAQMPLIAKVHRVFCPACKKIIETDEGDCCVYCSHGSEKCLKMQLWEFLSQSLDNTL